MIISCEHQAKSGEAEALQSADLLQKAGARVRENMFCVHSGKVWKKQKQCISVLSVVVWEYVL